MNHDTDGTLEFPECLLESPPRSQNHSQIAHSMVFSKLPPNWGPWRLPHSKPAGLSSAPRLPLWAFPLSIYPEAKLPNPHRQTEQEVLLARLIEKAIRRSNAIDTESLCIVAGQKCWQVRVDVHFLHHDGGLVDASCIAVVAALQHFRRPDVSVDGEKVIIHTLTERVPVPLSILHVPVCVTYSFYHGGEVSLVDATLQEEQLRDGDMTITLNKFGEVCQIQKAGGLPIGALALLQCARVALVKVQEITAFIQKRLEEDQEFRTKRDNLLESTAENAR